MQNEVAKEIYESEEYIEQIEKLVNDHEVAAIRVYLATKPLVGKPSDDWPGLFTIDWGKNSDIQIYYAVSPDLKSIFLVWAVGPGGKPPDTESDDSKEAISTLRNLRCAGLILGIRALWEIAKEFIKDIEKIIKDWL